MKQFIYILLLTVTGIFAGCTDIDKENPYDNQLHSLQVTAVYPDGYTDHLREGVTVKIEDVDRGNSYKAKNRQEWSGAILFDQRYIPRTSQRQRRKGYFQRIS